MNAKERSAILAHEALKAEAKAKKKLEKPTKSTQPKEEMSRDKRDNVKIQKPKSKK